MAPDARTFLALQTSSNATPDSPYISRDDETEAKLVSPQGLGDVHYMNEEDVRGYNMEDFGMGVNPDDLLIPRSNR